MPSDKSFSAKCEPMKPAPPVINVSVMLQIRVKFGVVRGFAQCNTHDGQLPGYLETNRIDRNELA